MAADSLQLNYDSPPQQRSRFSVTACVCSAIVLAVLLLDLLLIIPKLDAVLRDYAAWTPVYTDWLYYFSQYIGHGWWLVLLPLPVLVGFLGAVPIFGSGLSRQRARRRAMLLTAIALASIALLTTVAMILPLIALIRGYYRL
jgi:hypothetical protein